MITATVAHIGVSHVILRIEVVHMMLVQYVQIHWFCSRLKKICWKWQKNDIEEVSEQGKYIMKKTYGGTDTKKGITYLEKHINLIVFGGGKTSGGNGNNDIKGR